MWSECKNLCLYMPVHNEVDVTILIDTARGQGKKFIRQGIIQGILPFGNIQGMYTVQKKINNQNSKK